MSSAAMAHLLQLGRSDATRSGYRRRPRPLPSPRPSPTIRNRMVIGYRSFRSQVPTGSCWTVDMTQPGPDPDNYPPIDPTEPVPDDPGPSLRIHRRPFL